MIPPARRLLRMLAFTVSAALAVFGIQPVIAAATGHVPWAWALSLSAPSELAAAIIYAEGRLAAEGPDALQPPWYSAWLLLPGAFLLSGAASMCVIGALVVFPAVRPATWLLLVAGAATWVVALAAVRLGSRTL